MREVGLKENVVHTHLVDQTAWRGLLEPVTSIDVPREVFRRQQVEFRVLLCHIIAAELVIERFVFDSTTHQGEFDTRLKKGTLAVVSGKIVKQSPEAMRIKTPAAIMGVRGTEFIVKVDEPAAN